jgi:hypothetical protein
MEDQGFSLNAVTAAIAGDKESFMAAFNSAIANKVTDALELKKVEIASNLLGAGQESNESETIETEVDGSGEQSAETSTESAE